MTDPTTLIEGEEWAPYLAVDMLPENSPGTFLVDASEVDSLDLLGWGMDGWLNVVCDVQTVELTRAATRLQGPLTRAEAGVATIVLEDIDRRFDPVANGDAIHPGTQVRVRAWAGAESDIDPWEAVLFSGRIGADGLAVEYRQSDPPIVTVTAVDVIGWLALFSAIGHPDPGTGAGDTLRVRTQRVLDESGVDATIAADSDAVFTATLAPSPLAAGWDDVTAAADAELGRVWVTAADELMLRGRGSELSGPVRGTLSDVHGESVSGAPHCCYRDPVVRFAPDSLVNRAVAARRVPSPADNSTPPASAIVQVDDLYSQARWTAGAPFSYEDRSLELNTDVQLQPWAEALLLAASSPELRVDSVSPAPGESAEAWKALCTTDVGDRWHFRHSPAVGPTIARTVGVLGIRHLITPAGWETTWLTVEAPTPGDENPAGWVTVGLSVLDTGDVLAPFGGPVP